jgi:hypothetical protein
MLMIFVMPAFFSPVKNKSYKCNYLITGKLSGKYLSEQKRFHTCIAILLVIYMLLFYTAVALPSQPQD